jgi:hypothetical protein
MGLPLFLVENLFSDIQFPQHVVAASEEASRAQAWRVATGRRSQQDRWTVATANTSAWLRVQCDQARAASCIALDRGHNLAGVQVALERSADGATWTQVLVATIPTASAAGTSIDAATGCVTEEGAWIRRFPAVASTWWRLSIPAMGAGLKPQVVGLWLGAAWSPAGYLEQPFDDYARRSLADESQPTPAGWRGAGPAARVREGQLNFKIMTQADQDAADYHIRGHFHGYRRPMWIVHDEAQAERAVLADPAVNDLYSLRHDRGWSRRQGSVAWIEREPRIG